MWNYHQEHAVQFIRDTLELDESAEEIMEAINIMYVNSVNMELGPGHGDITGFYPVFANMNHDCDCNTKTLKLSDNRLEVRCVKKIAAGDEITTQYVSPDKHTKLRRRMLFKKWFFWCSCSRCCDPTECGSYLSALLCSERGCGGVMLLDNPLDEESDYCCLDCGHSFSHNYADSLSRNAEKDLKSDNSLDIIERLELFLYKHSSMFHPHHHIMINIKQKLGVMYGNCEPYSYKDLTLPMLERKIQVCGDVIRALDKVDPGLSKWRINMINEITKARLVVKMRVNQKIFASG